MISIHHVSEANVQADLHLYCGRKGACKRADLVFADLGNPHWMKDESQRDAVCDAYAKECNGVHHPHWKTIQRIGKCVHKGKSVALYCFCAPKRCHCETIKRWAEDEAYRHSDDWKAFSNDASQ